MASKVKYIFGIPVRLIVNIVVAIVQTFIKPKI